MNPILKTCSMALALCTLAETASAQIFYEGDWSTEPPGITTFTDGTSGLGVMGLVGTRRSATENNVATSPFLQETGGNPGNYLSAYRYNFVLSVAIDHDPIAASEGYQLNFDYFIDHVGSWTRWEVIGVEAGQTVTNLTGSRDHGTQFANGDPSGPVGGIRLAYGSLPNLVTDGWQSSESGPIIIEEDVSSLIFRIYREGNGTTEIQAGFDNITIIPEPSTYAAFFGAFVLGIALWRRRTTAQR